MKKILFKFLANPTSLDFYDGLILFAFTLVILALYYLF
jgi:hypothetical protein